MRTMAAEMISKVTCEWEKRHLAVRVCEWTRVMGYWLAMSTQSRAK